MRFAQEKRAQMRDLPRAARERRIGSGSRSGDSRDLREFAFRRRAARGRRSWKRRQTRRTSGARADRLSSLPEVGHKDLLLFEKTRAELSAPRSRELAEFSSRKQRCRRRRAHEAADYDGREQASPCRSMSCPMTNSALVGRAPLPRRTGRRRPNCRAAQSPSRCLRMRPATLNGGRAPPRASLASPLSPVISSGE